MFYRIIYFIAVLPFFMQCTPVQNIQVKSIEWKIAAQIPAPDNTAAALGLAGPVAGINKNKLIIAGGANFPGAMPWLGGSKKYYDDAYIFSLDKNDSVSFLKTVKLPNAIAYSAVCSTPIGIIYAGGENEAWLTDKVSLIHWDEQSNNVVIKVLPALPFAVTNASMTFYNNNIYLAGGEKIEGVSDRFLKLNLDKNSAGWTELESLPKPLSHAVVVVQSNDNQQLIYVIGGRKKIPGSTSKLYSSNFSYDFDTNKWTENKGLPYALSAGTGMAAGKHSIFLFGGDKGETFHKTEELIAAIAKEKDEAKREQLNLQKTALQSTHPGFSKEILMYNTVSDEWSMVDSIPFDVPVTTVAIPYDHKVIIPSGEIKAGVRTPQVLSGVIHFK